MSSEAMGSEARSTVGLWKLATSFEDGMWMVN